MLVLSRTIHTAKKSHRCNSCCGRIEAGEKYERQRVVDYGDAWVFKAHLHCIAAAKILMDAGIEGDDGCYVNVIDMDSECRALVQEVDPETFAKCWTVTGGPDART